MDLASLDTKDLANTGVEMELENPATGEKVRTDKGEPVTITLMGVDSDRLKKRQNELTNDVLKKGFRPKRLTAEKSQDDRLMTLALATVSWQNITLDGQKLECNTENARKLYARLPWLADQIDGFIGDRANFLKA